MGGGGGESGGEERDGEGEKDGNFFFNLWGRGYSSR